MNQDLIRASHCDTNLQADQLDHDAWSTTEAVALWRYWSGEEAPPERRGSARILWTDEALLARFECVQAEPLIVSPNPQTAKKTLGLWDRDVSEIFLIPDPDQLDRYFEFEVAPTREWVDLAIVAKGGERQTDWDYHSGVTVGTRIEADKIVSVMRIPWSTSIKKPAAGDEWRVNLCRCVGRDPNRGYLAWQPTYADVPNFHVPKSFGRLLFE